MKDKISLFLSFFKIGIFTFGGGYAMISLMQKEVVEDKKWITSEDMSDMITISESTPGPISVNVATFVGYKVAGVLGALFATLGLICPSLLVITLLSTILKTLQENVIFQNAFFGIRAAVIALILKTFIGMYKECPKNIFSYLIMILSFILVLFFDVNAIVLIVCSTIIGVLYTLRVDRKETR